MDRYPHAPQLLGQRGAVRLFLDDETVGLPVLVLLEREVFQRRKLHALVDRIQQNNSCRTLPIIGVNTFRDPAAARSQAASITPLALGGFCAMRALSTRNDEPERASRPFDLNRDGFVMAEGSGILVLEEMKQALDRGAPIYAEVIGYGMSGDAYHITAPDPDGGGATLCMRNAIEDAGLRPEDIDYINAHGTSTKLNDESETKAIKAVFGEHAYKVAISSTKSMTGHLLGGAGGVEAAIIALTIKNGIIPPTINYDTPDPACDLDFVPNVARKAKVRAAMSNSFGFGGTNASLIFKAFEA